MDADYPYELAVQGGGPLVEIPIQWALDDWEQYCYIPDFSGTGLIESPVKVAEMWRLEFDAAREVGGCYRAHQPPVPLRAAISGKVVGRP